MANRKRTPDMTGTAKSIDDTHLLFERIGYRFYRAWLKGQPGLEAFYQSWNTAELRRVKELLDQ